MTLQTCFIKGGLIKYNLKRYWWVSVLSFVFMFCATILRILLSDFEHYAKNIIDNPDSFTNYFINTDVSMYVIIPTLSVIAAVCVMRYMQHSRSSNLLHSMPYKRSQLFASSYVSGLIIFLIPVLLTGIILAALSLFTKYALLFSLTSVLEWFLFIMLYGTAFYSVSILMSMFTGSSIAQLAFTYIVMAFVIVIYAISTFLFNDWLYAFSSVGASYTLESLFKLTPFAYAAMPSRNGIRWLPAKTHIIMGVYIVLSYIISLILYKKRNMEHSGDLIVFKVTRPIFLYGVVFCAAIVGAGFIKALTEASDVSLIALIIFGLIGFSAAKMLMLKSFRILKYYKSALVCCLVLALGWCCVEFNIFGYGQSVPKSDSLSAVYVSRYNTYYDERDSDIIRYAGSTDGALFKEPENINTILEITQKAIDENIQKTSSDAVPFNVTYIKKNGQKSVRQYCVLQDTLFNLYNLPEAKEYMTVLLRTGREKIDKIYINKREDYFVLSQDDMDSFLDAIISDADSLTYDEFWCAGEHQGYVEIFFKADENGIKRSYYLDISSTHTNTHKWLDENAKWQENHPDNTVMVETSY